MFNNCYSGRRVFITGHTGFKGSWLTLWLQSLGAQVYGFSRDVPTSPALFDILGNAESLAAQPAPWADGAPGIHGKPSSGMAPDADPAITPGMSGGIPGSPSALPCPQPGIPGGPSAPPHPRITPDMRGDIRDRAALIRAMRAAQPDIVFHLAAQSIVRTGYDIPAETFESNALGMLNLMEAIRATPGVRAAVCITSDKCYSNPENIWGLRETDPLGGDDPYSASKACAEHIAHAYARSFFMRGPRIVTARAGNVLGGGDWGKDRIVPDCARAWFNGQAVLLRNRGGVRPWQHVLEPLSGYLWLGACLLRAEDGSTQSGPPSRPEKGLSPDARDRSSSQPGTTPRIFFSGTMHSPHSGQQTITDLRGQQTTPDLHGQALNFAPLPGARHTVADVVRLLRLYWTDLQLAGQKATSPHPHPECTSLHLNTEKALSLLNWHTVLDFEETIRYTAEWYTALRHAGPETMRNYSLGQISAYTTCAAWRGAPWAD